jgi:hypothetical protein
MPLPSARPLSLSQIQAEFGGPANLSAYVRGGSHVQDATPNAGVSSSPTGLAMSQFLGTRKVIAHTVGKSGDATGSGSGTGSFLVATNTVTITPYNGVGPFTYAWTHISGTAMSAASPGSASTSFTRTAAAGASYSGVMRCTVTDQGYGNRQSTVDVTVGTTHTSAYVPVGAVKSGDASSFYLCADNPPTYCPTQVSTPTNAVTISASGGTSSYTYSWAHISGDTFTVNSPASATTTFTRTTNKNQTFSGVYRCTVSDGITSASVDVTVTSTYEFEY